MLEVKFKYISSEVNPHFANIVSPTEVVVVATFHIDLEGGGGDMHVTMPYSMLEPIRELLDAGVQSDRSEVDERWGIALREEMKTAEIEISSILTKTQLTLRQISDLQAGDIIPIKIPETVNLLAEGVPVFKCSFGDSNHKKAVKVIEKFQHNQSTALVVKTAVEQ